MISSFCGIRIMKVMVVERYSCAVVKVVVPVVPAWTSKVVLDVMSFIVIFKAKLVTVLVVFDWPLVLWWDDALKSSPLDGWLHGVGVGLLFWVVHLNIVVSKVSSPTFAVISIVPEVRVLVHWNSVWVESEVPIKVFSSSVFVELSISASAPCGSDLVIPVIKDVVEVSLEGATGLGGGYPD